MVERAELHAADIDPAAVRCARRNVGVGARVYEGDLYEPLPATLRGTIDVLVVNAPYVPTDALTTLPPEARDHEPRSALDGGEDGLDVQRRVIGSAPQWLAPGGHLLIETSERQAPVTVDLFIRGGFIPRVANSAEFDATVVVGRVAGTG
jgi:release factor glutamine methyltransferase